MNPDLTPSLLKSKLYLFLLGLVCGAFLLIALIWQRIDHMQGQLVMQTSEAMAQAAQAKGIAQQSQITNLDTAAKLALAQAQLTEIVQQRNQLNELVQSLSRSRDENMVADIDAALRLAQQQAQLNGSTAPLLAALQSSQSRISRAAQPRMASVLRALIKDIDIVKSANVADTPTLLFKLDELSSLIDEASLANSAPTTNPKSILGRKTEEPLSTWWSRIFMQSKLALLDLVRVSQINAPEAALLSPEQAFFVRENLKLRIVNARIGLMSRQTDSVRADISSARLTLARYFDPQSRKTQLAMESVQQLQTQLSNMVLPRIDNSLSALAAVAAGR